MSLDASWPLWSPFLVSPPPPSTQLQFKRPISFTFPQSDALTCEAVTFLSSFLGVPRVHGPRAPRLHAPYSGGPPPLLDRFFFFKAQLRFLIGLREIAPFSLNGKILDPLDQFFPPCSIPFFLNPRALKFFFLLFFF